MRSASDDGNPPVSTSRIFPLIVFATKKCLAQRARSQDKCLCQYTGIPVQSLARDAIGIYFTLSSGANMRLGVHAPYRLIQSRGSEESVIICGRQRARGNSQHPLVDIKNPIYRHGARSSGTSRSSTGMISRLQDGGWEIGCQVFVWNVLDGLVVLL
ncbi:hypothetical protein L218DRAFT_299449 [Marasmius fiardii PR-910]|nr:hypothetical protein L218DRAFT_299449 [Marasmius fiardii PR-910]